jgi:hypothetical protein
VKWEDDKGNEWELHRNRTGSYKVFFEATSLADAEKLVRSGAVGARLVKTPTAGTSHRGNSREFRNLKLLP